MFKIIGVTVIVFFGFIFGLYLIENYHISQSFAVIIFILAAFVSLRIVGGVRFFIHIKTGIFSNTPPNMERIIFDLKEREDIEIAKIVGMVVKKMTGDDFSDVGLDTDLWLGGPLSNYRINYRSRTVLAARLTRQLGVKVKESNLDSLRTMHDFINFVKLSRGY